MRNFSFVESEIIIISRDKSEIMHQKTNVVSFCITHDMINDELAVERDRNIKIKIKTSGGHHMYSNCI